MKIFQIRSLALAAAVFLGSSLSAQAGVVSVFASASLSGTTGQAWAYSEAGGRYAYSAAAAECTLNGNCGASAQSISSNDYEVRFSPTQAYIDAYGVTGGSAVWVELSYDLRTSGQATATLGFGATSLQANSGFGGSDQNTGIFNLLMGFDGAAGNYLTIIKLDAVAQAGANGVNFPGPVVSTSYADPIFSPIDAGNYVGGWTFSEDLSAIGSDEEGVDPGLPLPIEPPQVPVPAGLILLGTGIAAFGLMRRRA